MHEKYLWGEDSVCGISNISDGQQIPTNVYLSITISEIPWKFQLVQKEDSNNNNNHTIKTKFDSSRLDLRMCMNRYWSICFG